jgi:3-methyladenine DNA glycosylase AlkD
MGMSATTSTAGRRGVTAELIEAIRGELRARADPVRAPGMQAYMKSSMPYLGVPVPNVRRLTRAAAVRFPPRDLNDLRRSAQAIWRTADYREERYAATELTGLRMATGRLELLDLWREMIVTGAWWDHVDAVAHRIGDLLVAHPDHLTPLLRDWSRDPDRWLRRSSIICQLSLKSRTDVPLLQEVILVNAADPEFFVRKAIGWALRDYARTDPDWVRSFVGDHATVLSPLSRREALKHLT